MTALRKALGDGQNGRRFIVTIALRGYSFVEPLTASAQATPAPDDGQSADHNLPPRRNRLLGREAELERLVAELPRRHCVSLVGCGGIGKTRPPSVSSASIPMASACSISPSCRTRGR
jgi:hypothetical protein